MTGPAARRSARERSGGEEKERPRFAVWGGRMNLLKAGGTAAQTAFQASSNRGMHTTPRRDSLMVKRWLKRASEPSRTKQGTQAPARILPHFQGRRSMFSAQTSPSHTAHGAWTGASSCPGTALSYRRLVVTAFEAERKVEHPLERRRPGGDLIVLPALVVQYPEVFVR